MKSIIFNDEMVRAVLSGYKTETRRPIKIGISKNIIELNGDPNCLYVKDKEKGNSGHLNDFAPYEVGEVVYMRECFKKLTPHHFTNLVPDAYLYRADFDKDEIKSAKKELKWTPSIHMSEKDSRRKFRILECYADKLNDISIISVIKEGANLKKVPKDRDTLNKFSGYCWTEFSKLWDSCYESPYDWKSNPYVWVIKFEVIDE